MTKRITILMFLIPIMGLTLRNAGSMNPQINSGFTYYTVTPLQLVSGYASAAWAMNSRGQVVGYAGTGGLNIHAFLFDGVKIKDLGTLGGDKSYPYAINDLGYVVGESRTVHGEIYPIHAFLYDGTKMIDLDKWGTSHSVAGGINYSGQIIGYTAGYGTHGWLYSDGKTTFLPTFGGTESAPAFINASGQVAGDADYGSPSTSVRHAFLYGGGKMMDLGTLGGDRSFCRGMNSSGQVIGISYPSGKTDLHAFYYDGKMHDLGTFGGSTSYATSINDGGAAVGYASIAAGNMHAFLYDNALRDLGTLPGCSDSRAYAINNSGQIVGGCGIKDTDGCAFFYSGGKMVDLNTLINRGSGVYLESATLINDAGQIVASGGGIAYLLTPSGSSSLPAVTTAAITEITSSTATGGGNVTSDGGLAVTARGVCWSLSANPTTANSCTNNGNGTGVFASPMTDLTPKTTYHVRAYATNSTGTAYGSDLTFKTQYRGDFLGSWSGQGIFSRNSDTGEWTAISTSAANQIVAGDLDGDIIDDLIGNWPGSGVWVKYSSTGQWARLASSADCMAAGDINGDKKSDLIGIWSGSIWVRDSASGTWIFISAGATQIAAGDIDGDGKADIFGVWPGNGVYAKLSISGSWVRLSSAADWIAAGDISGDGKADLLGIWGTAVWSYNTITGTWTQLSAGASQVIAGDLDGDGIADLIGIWPGDGAWVKYSATGNWKRLGSAPDCIAVGRLR